MYFYNPWTAAKISIFCPYTTATFVFSAQLQQLANQPNGQTRMDTERRLQKQKQTVEAQLSQKAQELLQHRLVSRVTTNSDLVDQTHFMVSSEEWNN